MRETGERSRDPADAEIGRIDEQVANQLGVESLTILAIRPDRFVGLRHDSVDLQAVTDYTEQFEEAVSLTDP